MKKIVSFLLLLIFVLSFYTPALAASVPAETFPGNDAEDYTPPDECILYQIPDSDIEGSHTVLFDDEGTVSSDGSYIFTVIIGTLPGNDYTQVLSWSSNFPIYGIIVNGEDAFNLYQYDSSFRGDTDLIAPTNSLELPTDVSHVSIILCPNEFPADPSSLLPIGIISSVLIVNTVFQIISTILLGVIVFFVLLLLFGSGSNLFGLCTSRYYKKSEKTINHNYHCKMDKDCNTEKDKDCNHKNSKCHKIKKDCDNKSLFHIILAIVGFSSRISHRR